jgi:DNA-binding SARP family transcriptional activator
VDFTLLGPVAVWCRGQEIAITSAQQRCVLALLLLDAGHVVSLDRLVDALWRDDEVPRTARNVVQACMTRLRRGLEADSSVRLLHRAPGYVLQVDEDRIDLHRFRALVALARDTGARDGDERARVLRRALRLWQGEPLADADAPGLAAVRQALSEERLAVLEECLAAEIESGGHAEVVPELRTALAAHPLRERLAALLVLALYRSGRQAEALQLYQHVRRRLVEELGTDPGPELRHLHQRILTADPALTPAEPADAPAPATARTAAPRQLPAAPVPFVGRRDELDRLDAALGEARTVVVSAIAGSGGIGKTWLALHWAHRHADRYPDGQLFVDLRGFSPDSDPLTAQSALRGFLAALGADTDRLPADLDEQAALYRSLLAGKRVLVTLDNAASAEQVVPLLPGSPACTVLITGRRKLTSLIDRHGARHLQLGVLSPQEARALLVGRLGAARVAAEPGAVDELIERCGCYPLALSIAARRIHTQPHVPLAELTAELREAGLDALDDDDSAASLPAVLSWSSRGLTAEQRTLFALLAIAPGPDIDLPAAASLTGLPVTRTRRALRGLEDASLIDRHPRGRYRMHDLVRAYAGTTAQDDLPEPVRRAALDRVVDFYLHTALSTDRFLTPHRPPIRLAPPAPGTHSHPFAESAAALTWLDAHHPHLLAAQHTAAARDRHEAVWHLAWTLSSFHLRRGHHHDDLAAWRTAAAAVAHLPDPTVRTTVHRFLGRAHTEVGLHEQAVEHLHRSLALAEHHRDPTQQALTHHALARAWGQRGDHRRALRHARHAHDHCRTIDQPAWEADALNAVAWHAACLGDYDTAEDHCRTALALHRRHRHPHGEARTLDSLGYIAHHVGHHRRAVRHYHQALALRRSLGYTSEAADTLDHLGHPHSALGQHDQAREVWCQARELYRRQGRNADAERVQRQLDDLDENTGTDRDDT